VTIVIGYAAAGLTKLLHAGWLNGYTLQGIVLGHRGHFADVAAAHVGTCQVISVVTVLTETLSPLCLWFVRVRWVLVPLLTGFHFATWATMDTGPYLTLWYLLVAFVPLDLVPGWLRDGLARRPMDTALVALAGAAVLGVVLVVMLRVVPVPVFVAAAACTATVWCLDRARPAATRSLTPLAGAS